MLLIFKYFVPRVGAPRAQRFTRDHDLDDDVDHDLDRLHRYYSIVSAV